MKKSNNSLLKSILFGISLFALLFVFGLIFPQFSSPDNFWSSSVAYGIIAIFLSLVFEKIKKF